MIGLVGIINNYKAWINEYKTVEKELIKYQSELTLDSFEILRDMLYLKTELKIFEGDADSVMKQYEDYLSKFNSSTSGELNSLLTSDEPTITHIDDNKYSLLSKVRYETLKDGITLEEYEVALIAKKENYDRLYELNDKLNFLKSNFFKYIFSRGPLNQE